MTAPKPYDVSQYGTDSSGRAVLMNARMALALEHAYRRLDFVPTIVQGAYMSRLGGGAVDSAGYHDEGGCLDWRTWNLTVEQKRQLVVALRSVGWAAWRRDAQHGGMDEHCHAVLMGDTDAAWGAKDQMAQYKAGLNGLSSRGGDYEPRPSPLVTDFDYYEHVREDALLEQLIKEAITEDGKKTRALINTRAAGTSARLLAAIDELPDNEPLTKKQTRDLIERALAEPEETL